MAHTLLRQRSDLEGPILVSQSQRAGGLWGDSGLSGKVASYRLEVARYQPRRWPSSMMLILWFLVYMLYRVDRSIHIAVSTDMDIPMTYASLD